MTTDLFDMSYWDLQFTINDVVYVRSRSVHQNACKI